MSCRACCRRCSALSRAAASNCARRRPALLDELTRGALDVVHARAAGRRGATSRRCALFDDPFLLAVPASDPRRQASRVDARDIDQERLILLEEGHCLRDQALAFCAAPRRDVPAEPWRDQSLATVMQMVANGYGVTLVPQIALDVEVRDERVKLLRFRDPEPARKIGLGWRRTSPRKADFVALGQIVRDVVCRMRRRRDRSRAGRADGGRSAQQPAAPHVTVYDRMPSAGRKFLMAGRGGLNLTHSEELEAFLRALRRGGRAQLRAAVEAFPPAALRAWCEGLGPADIRRIERAGVSASP